MTLKWVARISALAVILFGLPFYFGYGNPLPFICTEYSLMQNFWLVVFPLMFIGLGFGWKSEKTGGVLVTVPIVTGIALELIIEREIPVPVIIPLIIGIFYIIASILQPESSDSFKR
ncbi:MAG: hypothetical protein GXY77_08770 [Fibrobacter sp.]|nr:hypothetical protein [Fibrobacter sp.]